MKISKKHGAGLLHPFNDAHRSESLITTAWTFACSTLWSDLVFSEKEKAKAKRLISLYFLKCSNSKIAYLSFCQRVLLAHQYVRNASGRFIPLPSVWLHPENPKGFCGTRPWFEKITEVRRSLPNYKMEWEALAEAVLDVRQQPSLHRFQYWKNYFIEKRTPLLLTLFLNIIANQQFYK